LIGFVPGVRLTPPGQSRPVRLTLKGGAAIADPYSAKPWLKFYDKHVPPNLEYPEKTSLAYFREAVKSVPRKVAVHYLGRGITFSDD